MYSSRTTASCAASESDPKASVEEESQLECPEDSHDVASDRSFREELFI